MSLKVTTVLSLARSGRVALNQGETLASLPKVVVPE
jgi:hypothetical protein